MYIHIYYFKMIYFVFLVIVTVYCISTFHQHLLFNILFTFTVIIEHDNEHYCSAVKYLATRHVFLTTFS